MKKLSIALAVYNEERYIGACLDSVKKIADEIVVVDGGSTDKTIDIITKYTTQIIRTDNPAIFHINKQKALEACTGEWILQLDADEIVTTELAEEILRIISFPQPYNGYYIPRKNNFWGHFMKKTGVYPDYVVRLVKNGKASFPCKSVHEQIEIEGDIGFIQEPLLHYSYETLHDYWRKAKSYTSLTAQELLKKNIKINTVTAINYFFVFPLKTFFTLFIRNQGFRDGVYGFLFSLFSSCHHPIAYWKLMKLNN